MSNFYVREGHFWIDDQPQLIQAGEFHYYRTPKDQWAQRLGLLKEAGFNTLATYIPWLWHQLEENVSDLDGHSHPMRDLAGFLDLAAAMGFWLIPRPGPYIMAETINEGIPPWLFSNYPQVAFISQDETVQNIVSYLHPDFLACVKTWYQAVFAVLTPRQITNGGRVIMIQLDNEIGMPHWVRNIFDINPDTINRFAAYVQNQYGDQLPHRYPTANLPEFLRANLMHPTAPHAAHLADDYRHFYREYVHAYMTFLWDEAKTNGMNVPPIVNVHGFMNGGKTFPIGLSQLIKIIEMDGMVSATDVYPITIGEGNFHQLLFVNEVTKALHNPEQALFSAEFQAGGNPDFGNGQSSFYDLHSRLCVSSGMRAINHYLFCDGENDPILSPSKRHDWGHPVRKDGTVRKHYHRYGKLSAVLNSYGRDLVVARPQPSTTIGFLLDNFMTEVNNTFSQEATNLIIHQRELILCDFIVRGLALTHRAFDMLELTRTGLDVEKTPLLWFMLEKQCPASVQQKLVDYVNQGGKLILAGRMCEEDFSHKPCTILKDALGITTIHSDAPFTQTNITIFSYPDVPVSFVESYTSPFDAVFATRASGETVGFIQTVGQGKVMLLAAALTANTLDDLDIVQQMAQQMNCPTPFQLSEWADVRLSAGEKGGFLFINNYQDDPVAPTISHADETLFGGNPVPLPARRGLILPLEWQINEGVTLHYCTAEISRVIDEGSTLTLKTEPAAFVAELTLSGYTCAGATGTTRVKLTGAKGTIELQRK